MVPPAIPNKVPLFESPLNNEAELSPPVWLPKPEVYNPPANKLSPPPGNGFT